MHTYAGQTPLAGRHTCINMGVTYFGTSWDSGRDAVLSAAPPRVLKSSLKPSLLPFIWEDIYICLS